MAPGEVLGFLGPNGASKSTTIKILIGRMRPQSGTARMLGADVAADDPAMQARIGVSSEEKNLYESMSAEENLRFFASLFGIKQLNPPPACWSASAWPTTPATATASASTPRGCGSG